jgi:PIN domain nuclease of toxin-antitoxin system
MMQVVLLDTMALLWMGLRPDLLGTQARKAIEADGELCYSIVSLWEIGIKMSGKGFKEFELPTNWEMALPQRLQSQRIPRLDILPRHCRMIQNLPFHHRDPFDRMIIAQALEQNMAVITSDEVFEAYGVRRIW